CSSCRATMPAGSANRLLTSFNNRVRALDRTRQRVDTLVVTGHLPKRAAEQMYESLFLSSFTAFEVYIEDVFLTHLSKGRKSAKAIPRLTVRSMSVARELVIGPGR